MNDGGDEWICEQNIEPFRDQLAAVRDERQRAIISGLLAQEERKLIRLRSTRRSGNRSR